MCRKLSRLVYVRKCVLALVCFIGIFWAVEIRAQSTLPHEITISAAISLKNAFEEIGKTFMEKHPSLTGRPQLAYEG